jgi:peptidoglycan hydrolase-like protein with peptidoglycan-binding domain
MRNGNTGEPVKKPQDRLRELGFDPGGTDGIFGPKTEAAVKAFQRHEGIEVDGIVGPDTWKHLGIKVEGHVDNGSAAPHGQDSGKNTVDIGGPQPAVVRQGHFIGLAIADKFDAMVAAAKADGVELRITSGYRSHAEQQKLWDANPNPKYVARPGTSNHEKGNAIDFTNTPGAWAWLKKNAARFGMHNYPVEAWHYSLDGR